MIELQLNQTSAPIELAVIRSDTETLLRRYVEEARIYAQQTNDNANVVAQQLASLSLQLSNIESRLFILEQAILNQESNEVV